ncbi:MAG: DMT family transporter [Fusobacterium sp. JB021]|nr:DMT family transporter [Fusobacterium sp. JB021]MDP0506189.1 DMT family transporter [Fusobacterium sp. JB019]
MKPGFRGVIITIIGACGWGFSGACGQYLFENYNMDAYWLTTIRMMSAGIILMMFNFFYEKEKSMNILKNRKDLFRLILFAILGLLPAQLFYLLTISYSNAGTATVLQYIGPVMIMIYVCFNDRRSPTKCEFMALLFVVLGTLMLATRGDFGSLALSPRALFYGILSAIGLFLYSVLPGDLMKKYGAKVVAGYGMVFDGVILKGFMPENINITLDINAYLAIIGIVLVGTIGAFVLYLQGVLEIGASKASMIASVEPVSASLFAFLWLGTIFVKADIIGIMFIISAVLLVSSFNKNKGS